MPLYTFEILRDDDYTLRACCLMLPLMLFFTMIRAALRCAAYSCLRDAAPYVMRYAFERANIFATMPSIATPFFTPFLFILRHRSLLLRHARRYFHAAYAPSITRA